MEGLERVGPRPKMIQDMGEDGSISIDE